MNGYQFIKKVKEIKPQVKVFFISVFEIDDIEFRRELPFVKVDEFIKKPILLEGFHQYGKQTYQQLKILSGMLDL